jgi:hypothetical protein
MRLAIALRLIAVAIAIVALADPVLTIGQSVRPQLMITILETATLSLPDGSGTRFDRALRVADAIRAAVGEQFSITVRRQPPQTHADPCPSGAACVVISDGARPRRLHEEHPVLGGVLVASVLSPNVAIRSTASVGDVNPKAAAVVEVELTGSGVTGRDTHLEMFDGNVLVGRAEHRWEEQKNQDVMRAVVRIEWTPVGGGVRHLRVVARPTENEITLLDNEAHVGIDVIDRASAVLIYEPRPTWNATFVRHALESDARFRLVTQSRVSTAVTIGTKPLRFDAASLDDEDVKAVVIAAPQLLSGDQVDVLERFVRARGGSAVLLIEQAANGPVQRLVPFALHERRDANAVAIGELKASELVAIATNQDATVLARAGNDPVVVSRPYGQGHIILSGAADAWRFRGEGTRFATFWRALIADAVNAAGERVVANLSATAAHPGEELRLDVEARSTEPLDDKFEATATLECHAPAVGNSREQIYLSPMGRDRFSGRVAPVFAGTCEVMASSLSGSRTQVPLVVDDRAAMLATGEDELSAAIAAHGGVVVRAGDEGALVSQLRQFATPGRQSTPVHPMRSPFWIVPFGACLGAEWWLRRRNGLR